MHDVEMGPLPRGEGWTKREDDDSYQFKLFEVKGRGPPVEPYKDVRTIHAHGSSTVFGPG